MFKEYKREVKRFLAGELNEPPPFPENYFSDEAAELALKQIDAAATSPDKAQRIVDAMEKDIEPLLDNTWGDTARAIVNNWLGLVYKFTNLDRKKQFMPGIDPQDPL